MTIDGIGRISHPLVLPARKKPMSAFSTSIQESIKLTEDLEADSPKTEDPNILILEEDKSLGTKIEQWAVEYTSKFVHAAGPKFYATTMAHILGTAYVKKGLPEVRSFFSTHKLSLTSKIVRSSSSYASCRICVVCSSRRRQVFLPQRPLPHHPS